MSLGSAIDKTLAYYADSGAIRTVGAATEFCSRRFHRRCAFLAEQWEADRGRGYPVALRAKAARKGVSAHRYLWLGLGDADTDRYLLSNDPIRAVNEEYIPHIHDKYVFQLMTEPHVGSLPELYGVVEGGTFRPLAGPVGDLLDVLKAVGKLVVKPADGGKGYGIYVIEHADGAVLINGEGADQASVSELASTLDNCLVQEFVRQHEYAEAIYPRATNTIRVHSIVDPESGQIGILRASHRFGSAESAPVDNWSRGGHPAPVDVETGRLKRLIVLDGASRSRLERHPETGAQVAGLTVPHWEEVRELVRAVADLHRPAPFVGWDVVVSDRGPLVIEGNARTSPEFLQLERGLLEDPRVRRLLDREHGQV